MKEKIDWERLGNEADVISKMKPQKMIGKREKLPPMTKTPGCLLKPKKQMPKTKLKKNTKGERKRLCTICKRPAVFFGTKQLYHIDTKVMGKVRWDGKCGYHSPFRDIDGKSERFMNKIK